MTENNFNIADLVDDLQPVEPIRVMQNLAIAGFITIIAVAAIIITTGARADLVAGTPDAMLLVRSGILALLGFGTAYSVLAMAKPSVGRQHAGWKTALAAAAIFPFGGVLAAATGDTSLASAPMASGLHCILLSLITGGATAVPMVFALRRGAPTSPLRAGWLVGVASGGLGALAYNFHCPFDSLTYTGLYYSIAVGVCAIAGRLIVPQLIRW